MSTNNAFQMIAYGYATTFFPHAYYIAMNFQNTGKWGNVSPRQNWDGLAAKMPANIHQRCVRARNAHLNGLEQAPLFAIAMLAGVVMKLPAADVNSAGVQYLIARMLYNLLYIYTSSEGLSFLRTAIWGWSVAIPVGVLFKAAASLNSSIL